MIERPFGSHFILTIYMSNKAKVMPAMIFASKICNNRGFEWNFRPFIKIIFCYANLLAAILKMVYLTMSAQYFSLETVISGIYATFPITMMLCPKSTLDVRMDFSFTIIYFCNELKIRIK